MLFFLFCIQFNFKKLEQEFCSKQAAIPTAGLTGFQKERERVKIKLLYLFQVGSVTDLPGELILFPVYYEKGLSEMSYVSNYEG